MKTRTLRLVWNVNTESLSLVGTHYQELADDEIIAHTCNVLGGWQIENCVVVEIKVPTR